MWFCFLAQSLVSYPLVSISHFCFSTLLSVDVSLFPYCMYMSILRVLIYVYRVHLAELCVHCATSRWTNGTPNRWSGFYTPQNEYTMSPSIVGDVVDAHRAYARKEG